MPTQSKLIVPIEHWDNPKQCGNSSGATWWPTLKTDACGSTWWPNCASGNVWDQPSEAKCRTILIYDQEITSNRLLQKQKDGKRALLEVQ